MKQRMNCYIFTPIVVCFVLFAAMSCALASESSDMQDAALESNFDRAPSLDMPENRPDWETFARTTIFADGGISDHGGNMAMQEMDVGFSKKFRQNPRFEFSAGLRYSLTNIDAPGEAKLPTSLHRLAATVGGSYLLNDKLTLGLMASPGLNSDFKVITASDLRVPVNFHIRCKVSRALTMTVGLAYSIGNSELQLLPMVGAMYQPSEMWIFMLGFPRTGVMLKANKTTEYYLGAEFSAGEYQLHDQAVGASVINYRDYRAVTGINWALSPNIQLGLAGGYSFNRRLIFRDAVREDLDIDNAPFGRFELKFLW